MRFVLLLYGDESAWEGMSDADVADAMKTYAAFDRALTEAGAYVGGDGLQPTGSATTLRLRDGEPILTDGPFAETREQLGGFYVIECTDLDEALRWAAQSPDAVAGATVEVRPVLDYAAYGYPQPEYQRTQT